MKVTRTLINSNLPNVEYFNTMLDIIDDQRIYPNKYKKGSYCAFGGDPTDPDYNLPVWTLVVFDGESNWLPVVPDSDYSLIITDEGLRAVTSALTNGYKLYFNKIQMFANNLRDLQYDKLLNTWTVDDLATFDLTEVFTLSVEDESQWKNHVFFNASQTTGGLQMCVKVLPTDLSSSNDSSFSIQSLCLYIADQRLNGNPDPVLFGIVALPGPILKTVDIQGFGNELAIYINTVLDNLGSVLDLEMLPLENCSLPVCKTELELPKEDTALTNHFNAYIVQNYNGTNNSALAIKNSTGQTNSWNFFTSSDNSVAITSDHPFAEDVQDYMFVCYDAEAQDREGHTGLYIRADGGIADKEAIGVRVGQTIVFAGTVLNLAADAPDPDPNTSSENVVQYVYTLECTDPGIGYEPGDVLRLVDYDFNITVISVDNENRILSFDYAPKYGSQFYPSVSKDTVYTVYAKPTSAGKGAKFKCSSSTLSVYPWTVDGQPFGRYINTPLYIGTGANAGMLTSSQTNSFVGWAVSSNSLKLGLDARVRATTSAYGTVQYATDNDVWSGTDDRVVNTQQLRDNYIIASDNLYVGQSKNSLQNRQIITSYLTFNKSIVGANYTGSAPVENSPVSFYGTAYRAQWADLAEYYHSDKYYPAGTLIIFGAGAAEITIASNECDGVISEKPGFSLGDQKSDLDLPVALVGKVPVLFDNQCSIHCGDKVYLSKAIPGRASTIPNGKCIGRVIEAEPEGKTKITCVVKINF